MVQLQDFARAQNLSAFSVTLTLSCHAYDCKVSAIPPDIAFTFEQEKRTWVHGQEQNPKAFLLEKVKDLMPFPKKCNYILLTRILLIDMLASNRGWEIEYFSYFHCHLGKRSPLGRKKEKRRNGYWASLQQFRQQAI